MPKKIINVVSTIPEVSRLMSAHKKQNEHLPQEKPKDTINVITTDKPTKTFATVARLGVRNQDVPRLSEGEVTCWGSGASKDFVGQGGNLANYFKEILEIPDPNNYAELSFDLNSASEESLTLYKRLNGGKYIWVALISQGKDRIERITGKELRENAGILKTGIVQVQEGEIICWGRGAIANFINMPKNAAEHLTDTLGIPDPKGYEDSTFELEKGDETLTLRKRSSGTHIVWVAEATEDRSKVERVIDRKLKGEEVTQIKPGEIACWGNSASKDFVGSTVDLMTYLKGVGIPDPRGYKNSTFELVKGKEKLILHKKLSGVHLIWAIEKTEDRDKVERVISRKLRDEEISKINPGEIICWGTGIMKDFRGGAQLLAKYFKDELKVPDPKDHEELTFKLVRKDEELILHKRLNFGRLIWVAEAAEDRNKVERITGKNLRDEEISEVKPGEIICWGCGTNRDFIGMNASLAKYFKDELLIQDPNNCKEHSVELARGDETLILQKRTNSGSLVWVTEATEDKDKIERVVGKRLRSQEKVFKIKDGEIICWGLSAGRDFIDIPKTPESYFKDTLGIPNPRDYKESTFKLVKGNEKLILHKRFNGSSLTWIAKSTEDLDKIERVIGKKLKDKEIPNTKDGEIVCWGSGASRDFIGRTSNFASHFKDVLKVPDPLDCKEPTFELITTSGKLILHKRLHWGHYIWVATPKSEVEKKSIEKVTGLKLKTNPLSKIDTLKLLNAIALFGNKDPLRLKQYIRIFHPELDEEDLNQIVIISIKGLKGEFPDVTELHPLYEENLEVPTFKTDLEDATGLETEANSFTIFGKCDAPFIQITGAYTRKILVKKDGTFQAPIPLPRTGECNEFNIYSFNPETEEKSPAQTLSITQTGEKENVDEAFLRLCSLKEETLEAIKENPGRYNFLLRATELSLLKHFTYSEKQGFAYLRERIKKEKSPALRAMLEAIQTKFKQISENSFNLKKGERLYFFQKWCINEIMLVMEGDKEHGIKPKRGIILANEQGLGKTVTALALANGENALVITPNPVVSTWIQQEKQFIPKPKLEALEGTYSEREAYLETLEKPQTVVNVEFTRGMTDRRAKLLSGKSKILIVDEADYLGSKDSQQSKGTAQIPATFKLLLTATPFKRPSQITNLLAFLEPGDPIHGSRKAFARAFDTNSSTDLNALYLLLQEYTIRIRKKDVFEEYDSVIPLEEQSDRLPKKVEVLPEDENTGQFNLGKAQCDSILELFTDYQSWCKKHKTSGHVTEEDQEYGRFKEGYFQKKEALRQIQNDPRYIGLDVESPKHKAMDKILKKELPKGKKILIFCRYRDQVDAYAERYTKFNPCTYYGGLKQNSNGYKVDDKNNVLYYKVDEYGDHVLRDGEFISSDKENGKPIRAFDYERIRFQNDPNSKIMVATYDAGAVGVTLTAADVVVYDDLAPTYRDQYQAGDRAHRIDNTRKKYDVTYYWLQALYPESFLERLEPEIREEYFDCGTYDQNHFVNLQGQSKVFHRIMDGIGSEDELEDIGFIKARMPFLFDTNEDKVEEVQKDV